MLKFLFGKKFLAQISVQACFDDTKDILEEVYNDGDDIFEKVSDDAKDILEKDSKDVPGVLRVMIPKTYLRKFMMMVMTYLKIF